MMDISKLSKVQLVEIVRAITGTVGDYARNSKQHYLDLIAKLPAEDVVEVIQRYRY